MQFTKLVPSFFYSDINLGLRTFVECLEFTIGHDEFALVDGQIGIRVQQW